MLKDQIGEYYERIANINFPERLDKIDNSISAINIGVQNIQTRKNDSERLIIKAIEDIERRQKKGGILSLIFLTVILWSIIALLLKSFVL